MKFFEISKEKRNGSNIGKRVVKILIAGCAVYFLFHLFYSQPDEKSKTLSGISHLKSSDRCVVKGLRINETLGGRPFFTAEIERVRYEHKKIGFLRFGMLPIAVVEGLKLTLYDSGTTDSLPPSQTKRSEKLPVSEESFYPSKNLRKAHLSRKNSKSNELPVLTEIEKYVSDPELLKLDRAHNIRFESLHFKIVRDGKEILTVNCRKLVPDITNHVLKLSGDVSIVAENKKVEGDSVSFDWKKNRFFSDKDYRLIRDENTVMRNELDTDIFLSSL